MEWNGMEWHERECNGVEWNGMEWNGMGWNGMEWDGMEWHEMDWNGMKWNGMEWHEMVSFCPTFEPGNLQVNLSNLYSATYIAIHVMFLVYLVDSVFLVNLENAAAIHAVSKGITLHPLVAVVITPLSSKL